MSEIKTCDRCGAQGEKEEGRRVRHDCWYCSVCKQTCDYCTSLEEGTRHRVTSMYHHDGVLDLADFRACDNCHDEDDEWDEEGDDE